jgi:predicted type IV restriction endonuclease
VKGPAGNEANTKALLIEPMLAALGWDVPTSTT